MAPISPTVEPLAPAAEATPAPSDVVGPSDRRGQTGFSAAEPAPAPGVLKVIPTPGETKEAADKKTDKDKKKGGKIELRPELKKDFASKFKEKAKRPKKRWDSDVVVEEPEAIAEVPVEARKWQDFKPIHRKEDRRGLRRGPAVSTDITKPRRKVVKLYEGMTVKEFSELIGQKVPSIISKLMAMGKMATINQPICSTRRR
ncbi:MAG: translation initiation factor IF-2 N-terminal domain-containing protein [Candidatus Manganitrophus sp.]|nr:translation initiation factor IF-2 N-terminal domain-containing protein [Candidatus Manganitrophus sp.]